MKWWGAAALLALTGCTTGITAPMDLANDVSSTGDMGPGCMLEFSGDVNMTVSCRIFLCHPTTNDMDDLDLAGPDDNPTGAHAIFDVANMYAVKSYTSADLLGFDVGVNRDNKSYRANNNGTAAISISGITRPSANPCDGVAHGTAKATLDEFVIDDAGISSAGPGHVTLNAVF